MPPSTPNLDLAPSANPLVCSAYSVPFKVIALLVVVLGLAWGWHLWETLPESRNLNSMGWIAAALAMMALTVWHVVRGKTTLTATTLAQTWVWHKQVDIAQLAYVKLVRVPGLDWLIAPRLYTRTHSNRLTTFYASGPVMLDALKRLEQDVKAHTTKIRFDSTEGRAS